METSDLIEKYLLETRNVNKVRLWDYNLNGSVIKVNYSITYHDGETSENVHSEIDLLDYITFVFKQK